MISFLAIIVQRKISDVFKSQYSLACLCSNISYISVCIYQHTSKHILSTKNNKGISVTIYIYILRVNRGRFSACVELGRAAKRTLLVENIVYC